MNKIKMKKQIGLIALLMAVCSIQAYSQLGLRAGLMYSTLKDANIGDVEKGKYLSFGIYKNAGFYDKLI